MRGEGSTSEPVWVHNAGRIYTEHEHRRLDAIRAAHGDSIGSIGLAGSQIAGAARPPRHHIFAQSLFGKNTEQWFSNRGVSNIHLYTVELGQGVHEAIHKWVGSRGWNDELRSMLLRAELAKGSKLSAREVWSEGYRLLRLVGIRQPTIVRYQE